MFVFVALFGFSTASYAAIGNYNFLIGIGVDYALRYVDNTVIIEASIVEKKKESLMLMSF